MVWIDTCQLTNIFDNRHNIRSLTKGWKRCRKKEEKNTYCGSTLCHWSPVIHFPNKTKQGGRISGYTEIGPRDEVELFDNPLNSLPGSCDMECADNVIRKLLDVGHGDEDVFESHATVIGPVLSALDTAFLL